MTAGGAHRVIRHQHARPRDDARLDRVAQSQRNVIVGSDIAYRGDAGLESRLGVLSAVERLLRREAHDAVVEIFVPVIARHLGEMHMGVDHTGQQCRIAQVDDLGVIRDFYAGTGAQDFACP